MFAKLVGPCLVGWLMLAIVQPASAQRGNASVQFEGQTIDEMVAVFMKEHRIPGMTLAIVQAPYIPRVVGYGVSDVERGLLASPKTLWNIGQMTQGYTAVAIMQLIEADKMALNDPVGQHLANLPQRWRDITVRQLMAHVSGLPDYTSQPSFQPAAEYKTDEVIAMVKDRHGLHPGHAGVQQRHRLLLARADRRARQRHELRGLRHQEPNRAPGVEEHALCCRVVRRQIRGGRKQ